MEIPFIGPSYVSRSPNVDDQLSVNLYPEIVESKDGKNTYCLIGSPGCNNFAALPAYPNRGHWVAVGRLFVVCGNTLFEVFSNGTYAALGTLLTSSYYVGMSDNGLQLCIVDGPNEYILTLSSNTWMVNPAGANFMGSNTVSFIDGYFVFTQPISNKFYLSSLYDGTTISDLDIAEKEGSSDNIVNTINDHRQLYIFGEKFTEVWYDSGGAAFPFAPIQGIFIECGLAAPFSISKQDNSLIFLGRDERGQGIVYRIDGFSPTRISTHAVERAIQSYGDLSSCYGYSYQEEGHSFYVLNGPNWPTTWVYDSSTQLWHERRWYNPATGLLERHRGNYHSSVFGKHIIGDYQNGNLYFTGLDTYADSGSTLVRIRRAPHISNDLERIFHSSFQVDMETGVGTDGLDQGNMPVMLMRYSNDGGHAWTPERSKTVGAIGQFKARAYWNKLGQARDRVYEVKITDPVKVVLIGAKVNAKPGRDS